MLRRRGRASVVEVAGRDATVRVSERERRCRARRKQSCGQREDEVQLHLDILSL